MQSAVVWLDTHWNILSLSLLKYYEFVSNDLTTLEHKMVPGIARINDSTRVHNTKV